MHALVALLVAIAAGNNAQFTPPEWVQPGSGSKAPFVNIKAAPYFAACDGSTPDTSAIASAMAAVGSGMVVLPPNATCVIDSTITVGSDGLCIVGGGLGSTLLYTGSSDMLLYPAPRRSGCMSHVAIRFNASTGATATAIHIQGATAGAFRFVFDHVAIYRGSGVDALLAPLTGQQGIVIDSTGATGGWFSDFSTIWMGGIDKPVVCGSTCNQTRWVNVGLEQYGAAGADGYGFDFQGNNNVVTNATFSRGGSSATNVWGFRLNGGTYNVLHGSADVGTGGLWTGTLGGTNTVTGTDSSTAALTAYFGQQIRLGATPATVGSVRMSNNTSISWRDSTNASDMSITLDSNNRMKLGTGAAEVRLDNQIMEFGTGTVANSGVMREAHATNLVGRNSANNGNRTVLDWGVGTADTLVVGDANMAGMTLPAPLRATNAQNVTTCSLNAGSPSTCTATVPSGSKCACSNQTTQTNPVKCSVASTTATVTGPNAATDVVTLICL